MSHREYRESKKANVKIAKYKVAKHHNSEWPKQLKYILEIQKQYTKRNI